MGCSSPYNAILGRPTLNRLHAVTSTYHLMIKLPTENGIGEVLGSQRIARECKVAGLSKKAKPTTILQIDEDARDIIKTSESADETKVIILDPADPNKTTKISARLSCEDKAKLTKFLQEESDVLAFSHKDMLGINPKIITHRFSIQPGIHLVKQKKRQMAAERSAAAREEVEELLKVGFIEKIMYPEWITIVVLVKKNNGKWRMCVDYTDLNKHVLRTAILSLLLIDWSTQQPAIKCLV